MPLRARGAGPKHPGAALWGDDAFAVRKERSNPLDLTARLDEEGARITHPSTRQLTRVVDSRYGSEALWVGRAGCVLRRQSPRSTQRCRGGRL